MRDKTTFNVQVTARVGHLRTDLEQLGRAALPTSASSHLPLCCYDNSGKAPPPGPGQGLRERCARETAEPGLSGEVGGGSLVPCTTSCTSPLPSSLRPLPGCSYTSWDSILAPLLSPACSVLPAPLEGASPKVAPPPTCPCESESHSVLSDSLQRHGLSMEFSRPEYWSG